MKLTDFEKQILHEAKIERTRLRHLQNELSDYGLAKTLGITIGQIKRHFEAKRKNRMSMSRAMDIANLIRIRKCPMSLFRVGLRWGVVETSELLDDDLMDDSFIATYNDKVTAQQIFNDCR